MSKIGKSPKKKIAKHLITVSFRYGGAIQYVTSSDPQVSLEFLKAKLDRDVWVMVICEQAKEGITFIRSADVTAIGVLPHPHVKKDAVKERDERDGD